MGDNLVECPKCGQQNEVAAEKCSKCGIGLRWALEHWSEVVSGPQDHDAPLILHVDDDTSCLTLVELILNQAGYRVAKAHDGYEALDLIPRLMPDVIITEVAIRGLSGFDLIYRLKASPTLQNIPLIVLTRYIFGLTEEMGNRMREVNARLQGWLTKDFAPQKLIEAVSSVLPPLASHEPHQS